MDRSYLYTPEELKSFVAGMQEANQLLRARSYDRLVVPMNGGVALVDALAVVDPQFEFEAAEYLPASSAIMDTSEVIREWYKVFLQRNPEVRKVELIDEVVSGSSVTKLHKNLSLAESAVNKERLSRDLESMLGGVIGSDPEALARIDSYSGNAHAAELAMLRNVSQTPGFYSSNAGTEALRQITSFIKGSFPSIKHHVIGIEDMRVLQRGKTRHHTYQALKDQGVVEGVPVDRIITMDQPKLQIAHFVPSQAGGYCRYQPHVQEIRVSPEYITFLEDVGHSVGRDASGMQPVNQGKILKAGKYLLPSQDQ